MALNYYPRLLTINAIRDKRVWNMQFERNLHLLIRAVLSLAIVVICAIILLHPDKLSSSREVAAALMGAITTYWLTPTSKNTRRTED